MMININEIPLLRCIAVVITQCNPGKAEMEEHSLDL